jgi:hypothetical protein
VVNMYGMKIDKAPKGKMKAKAKVKKMGKKK